MHKLSLSQRTLLVAASLATRPAQDIQPVEDVTSLKDVVIVDPGASRKSKTQSLQALAAIYGLGAALGVPLPQLPTPKPPREKTQADLDRLAAAEAKRQRKAKRK